MSNNKSKYLISKIISVAVLVTFFITTIIPPSYAQMPILPNPGQMVSLTSAFQPAIVKGIKIYPDNPFRFDFIVNKGEDFINDEQFKDESKKLVKYFLASLTVPEKDLWVNLSPYEKDRIIPKGFDDTEMGRDLLAQDYLLKQITSSLMYPESDLGKKFWDKVYKQAFEKFGTTDIPIDTFNKVWIVPEKAVVYENGDSAFVVEGKLKVMLEVDYLAKREVEEVEEVGNLNNTSITYNIIRQIIIPALENEVNTGKNFAPLRQIYNSLILATWFKRKLQKSIESKNDPTLKNVYIDKNKTGGVNVDDPAYKQQIYNRYLEAFKKGVYNYIKEDYDPVKQEIVPRKYFSGGAGLQFSEGSFKVSFDKAIAENVNLDNAMTAEVRLDTSDNAMSSQSSELITAVVNRFVYCYLYWKIVKKGKDPYPEYRKKERKKIIKFYHANFDPDNIEKSISRIIESAESKGIKVEKSLSEYVGEFYKWFKKYYDHVNNANDNSMIATQRKELIRELVSSMPKADDPNPDWSSFKELYLRLIQQRDKKFQVELLVPKELKNELDQYSGVFSLSDFKKNGKTIIPNYIIQNFETLTKQQHFYLTVCLENIAQHVYKGVALVIVEKRKRYLKISIIDNGNGLKDKNDNNVLIEDALKWQESFGKNGKAGKGFPYAMVRKKVLSLIQTNDEWALIQGGQTKGFFGEYMTYFLRNGKLNRERTNTIIHGYFFKNKFKSRVNMDLVKNVYKGNDPFSSQEIEDLVDKVIDKAINDKAMTAEERNLWIKDLIASMPKIDDPNPAWGKFKEFYMKLKESEDDSFKVELFSFSNKSSKLDGLKHIKYPWNTSAGNILGDLRYNDGFSNLTMKESYYIAIALENFYRHVEGETPLALVIREVKNHYVKISVIDNGNGFRDDNLNKVSINDAIQFRETFGKNKNQGKGLHALAILYAPLMLLRQNGDWLITRATLDSNLVKGPPYIVNQGTLVKTEPILKYGTWLIGYFPNYKSFFDNRSWRHEKAKEINKNISDDWHLNADIESIVDSILDKKDNAMTVEDENRLFIKTGEEYTISQLLSGILLEKYMFHASMHEGFPLIIIDGYSSVGKTTTAKQAKVMLNKEKHDVLYLNLDMFLIDRDERWEIIRQIYNGKLDPNSIDEQDMYDIDRIKYVLDQIDQFRKTGSPQVLTLPNVYNHDKKIYENKTFDLKKDMIFIVEGKFAQMQQLLPFYGKHPFRLRLLADPAVIKEMWIEREKPKRTAEEFKMLLKFYDTVMVPHFERYAELTKNSGLKEFHLFLNTTHNQAMAIRYEIKDTPGTPYGFLKGFLKQNKPISRFELMKVVGISYSTVQNILPNMVQFDIVNEIISSDNNENSKYILTDWARAKSNELFEIFREFPQAQPYKKHWIEIKTQLDNLKKDYAMSANVTTQESKINDDLMVKDLPSNIHFQGYINKAYNFVPSSMQTSDFLSQQDIEYLKKSGLNEKYILKTIHYAEKTAAESYGFEQRYKEPAAVDQLELLEKEFYSFIQDKGNAGKREVNIYQIGPGKEIKETLSLIKSFDNMVKAYQEKSKDKSRWTMNLKVLDFDYSILDKFKRYISKHKDSLKVLKSLSIELFIETQRVDLLDEKTLKHIGENLKGDFIFCRNVSYANNFTQTGHIARNNFRLIGFEKFRFISSLLNIFISTRNIVNHLSKVGAKVIFEPAELMIEGNSVLQIPGTRIKTFFEYYPDSKISNVDAIWNTGTGIYEITDLNEMGERGLEHFIDTNESQNKSDSAMSSEVHIWEDYKKRYDEAYDTYLKQVKYLDYSSKLIDQQTEMIVSRAKHKKGLSGGIYVVAIDGTSGAFKTTTSENLAKAIMKKGFNSVVIHRDLFIDERNKRYDAMDRFLKSNDVILNDEDYYLRKQKFVDEVLERIKGFNEDLTKEKLSLHLFGLYQKYNDGKLQGEQTVTIDRNTIVIIEGNFLFKQAWQNYFDHKILMLAKPSIGIQRRSPRDGAHTEELRVQKYFWRVNTPSFIHYLNNDMVDPDLIISTDKAQLSEITATDEIEKLYYGTIGLIGVGKQGRRHLRHLVEQGVEVVAADKMIGDDVVEQYRGNDSVKLEKADADKVLNDPNIKAVIIVTPGKMHYEIVKRALLAGKNVLVEKPFTRTTEQARELVALAKERNLILMVGHNRSYLPRYKRLKQIVKSGKLGRILSIEGHYLMPLQKNDTTHTALEGLGYHQLYMINGLLEKDAPDELLTAVASEDRETFGVKLRYGKIPVTIKLSRNYNQPKERNVIVRGSEFTATFDYSKEPAETNLFIEPTRKELIDEPIQYNPITLEELRKEAFLNEEESRPSLHHQLKVFREAVYSKEEPQSNGSEAISIVKTLENIRNKLLSSNVYISNSAFSTEKLIKISDEIYERLAETGGVVAIDGGAASLKSTFTQLLKDIYEFKYPSKHGLIFSLDELLKPWEDRAVLKKMVLGDHLYEQDMSIAKDNGWADISPDQLSNFEQSVWHNQIIELNLINFRRLFDNPDIGYEVTLTNYQAYIKQEQKRFIDVSQRSLRHGDVVFMEGKFANSEYFAELTDYRIRMQSPADQTRERFKQERGFLNSDELAKHMRYYDSICWPSWKKHAEKTKHLINSVINIDIPNMPGTDSFKKDQAMGAENSDKRYVVSDKEKGGIDLNPENLEIETRGESFDFKISAGTIDLENFTGFTPVIIRIVPITNVPLLLGLVEDKEKGKSKKEKVVEVLDDRDFMGISKTRETEIVDIKS